MNIQPDLSELLRLLEKHNVEYMIVGGYAVAFHGYVRNTKDLDIFYSSSPPNLERLRSCLISFGFDPSDVSDLSFEDEEIISFGIPPLRVDLLSQIDGISFQEAVENVVIGSYGPIPAKYICRADLIRNKSATSRLQDKVDVEKLTQEKEGQ